MTILSMNELDLGGKRVLIRLDLNVPMKAGKVSNDARLRAVIPTIQQAVLVNARILLISHLGRPLEGEYQEAYSLKPVAKRLSELLGSPVRFVKDWLEGIDIAPGEIVLGENVRFNIGEESCDSLLSKRMAALCDVFIMDAFASAHRAQASTVGVAQFAPIVAAGPLLSAELNALTKAILSPKRPLVAIVGGAKVSDKLLLLKSLLEKVDTLIIGGGIANTFIAALGYSVGSSLYELNLISLAKELLAFAKNRNIIVMVPIDVVVAEEISEHAKKRITSLDDIMDDEKILDVGPKTSEQYRQILKNAGTILWNGPLGVFELDAFAEGTKQLANAIAESNAFSIAGGGETQAAIDKFQVASKISYISTGGGAFLEFIEGKTLPAVEVLEKRSQGIF